MNHAANIELLAKIASSCSDLVFKVSQLCPEGVYFADYMCMPSITSTAKSTIAIIIIAFSACALLNFCHATPLQTATTYKPSPKPHTRTTDIHDNGCYLHKSLFVDYIGEVCNNLLSMVFKFSLGHSLD